MLFTEFSPRISQISLACLLACAASASIAQIRPDAGQTQREVIEIQHIGTQNGTFRIYTNDWTFQADGSLAFSNELAEGSCRPWVAVERRDLTITPNARYRYRFEITAPADTPPRECRFAIMIEGTDPARVEQSGVNT